MSHKRIPRFIKRMLTKIASPGKMTNSRVKEGYFAVYTIDEGELKRFVVELVYLTHPEFLRLLERAEEEFGFGQKGVLVIPCRAHELERVLELKD